MAAQLSKARTEIKSLVESHDLLQVTPPPLISILDAPSISMGHPSGNIRKNQTVLQRGGEEEEEGGGAGKHEESRHPAVLERVAALRHQQAETSYRARVQQRWQLAMALLLR